VRRLPSRLRVTAILEARFAIREGIESPVAPFEVPDLVLEDVLVIRGRVVDSTGAPVPGAQGRIFYSRGGLEEYGDLVARADPDGRLEFHPIARRDTWSLTLTVTHEGYPETETELRVADALAGRPFEVVLPAGIEIRGTAVTPAGEPIAGVQVIVARKQSGAPRAEFQSRVVTGKDGRFVLRGAPAEGSIPLLYAQLGRPLRFTTAQRVLPVRLAMVSGRNGQVVDLGAIAISAPGTIRGLVLDPGGAPLKGATVSVSPGILGTSGVSVQSGTDGRFVLGGIPAGTFEVVARRSYPERGTLEGRVKGVKAGDPDIVIEVRGGRAIVLHFHAAGDPTRPVPVPGYSMRATPEPPPETVSFGGSAARTVGRGQAHWRVKKEPGTYRVTVTPVGFESVDCGLVTVEEDRDTDLSVPCRPKEGGVPR
jgi:hypothetical protein